MGKYVIVNEYFEVSAITIKIESLESYTNLIMDGSLPCRYRNGREPSIINVIEIYTKPYTYF